MWSGEKKNELLKHNFVSHRWAGGMNDDIGWLRYFLVYTQGQKEA